MHADRPPRAAAPLQEVARDGVDQHPLVERARQGGFGEEIVPAAQPADVVVGRRAVVEVEQDRRPAQEDRLQQAVGERVGDAADRRAEGEEERAADVAQAPRAVGGRPHRRVGGGAERIAARVALAARQPSLAAGVRHRLETLHHRQPPRLELGELVGRPAHHRAHDAGDQRRRGDHQRRARHEVGGHLDAVVPRPHADAGRAGVGDQQHHRHRQQVDEEEREVLDRQARRAAAAPRPVGEGHVVVGAEAGEAHRVAVTPLPVVELAAHEADRLPQRAAGARRAAAVDLDRRRRHLDDAGVEVHRAAGRQVVGGALAVHQRSADEGGRAAEHRLRLRLPPVDEEAELGLEADRRQAQRPRRRQPAAQRCALGLRPRLARRAVHRAAHRGSRTKRPRSRWRWSIVAPSRRPHGRHQAAGSASRTTAV